MATWYHCFKRHSLQISRSTVLFLQSSTWNRGSIWFGYQALLPPSKRKQRKFSLTPYITLNSPLLYCIEESSESSVFPCSLWLYKAYITRKVFNQANNQRSSQEQVSNQPDLAGHACACRKNRMGEKFYRHSIPQRM